MQAQSSRLLLGNGASELIDLVIRCAPSGKWKAGPWPVQYMEYQRSASTNKYAILPWNSTERAELVCVVNPNNPTGEYMEIHDLMEWIEANVVDNGVVVVGTCFNAVLSLYCATFIVLRPRLR
jgi:histidinol-phosphate/aromatic aminotransferase/cobyric acid decarboxylase-like protein